MKKFLILATLIVAPFYAQSLDISGGITVGSDYLWRGTSQKGSSAISAGLEAGHKGWYSGAWVSEVDYGDKSDYEWDVYTGYSHDINDELSIDVGVIQYNFNNEDDAVNLADTFNQEVKSFNFVYPFSIKKQNNPNINIPDYYTMTTVIAGCN